MHVRLSRDGSAGIEERDDFKRFSVRPDFGRGDAAARARADPRIVFVSDDQVWVEAALVMERAGWSIPGPAADAFMQMLEKARPHGWVRDAPLAVAAHVEWPD
ncbi:MAG TPA: hypothetical protein PLE50_12300 [Rhabdaerophilum sp.]|jgi:hypothetical protein|nr:hypothetical protein [Rhabdaerophilum sp.]